MFSTWSTAGQAKIANSTVDPDKALMLAQYQQNQQQAAAAAQGPQLKHIEYTIAIDSRTRDKDQYPQPNDFVIPINTPQKSMPVTRMYLGSIELPVSQQTIENEWSRLYFDEGLSFRADLSSMSLDTMWTVPFPALTDDVAAKVSLTVQDALGVDYKVYITPWLNPITMTAYDVGPPGSATFETYLPHRLDLVSFWSYGSPVQIISSSGVPNVPLDGVTGPVVTIIDDYHFSISPAPPFTSAPLVTPVFYGYIHAPALANPVVAAQMITRAVNNVLQDALSPTRIYFDFSIDTSLFTVRAAKATQFSTETTTPLLYSVTNNAYGLIPILLGFPCATLPLPTTAPVASAYDIGSSIAPSSGCISGSLSNVLTAQSPYLCISSIRFEPGFYLQSNVGAFLSEAQIELNRFYFEDVCSGSSTTLSPPTLVTADACGLCYAISIPFGRYTPFTLAQAVQNQMNIDMPLYGGGPDPTYTVTFEVDADATSPTLGLLAGRFVFTSLYADSHWFTLEFDDSRNNLLPGRMGFNPLPYRRSSAVYTSDSLLYVPMKGCNNCAGGSSGIGNSTLAADPVFLSNVYGPYISQTTRTIGMQVLNQRAIPDATVVAITSVGSATTITLDTSVAHGYQVDDVVTVTFPTLASDPRTRRVRVVEVTNAFEFVIDVTGDLATELAAVPINLDDNVCVSLYNEPIMNLYFTDRDSPKVANVVSMQFYQNPIYPEMLGFPPKAVMWINSETSLPITAPNHVSLETPDYVLLEFVKPNESTYIQHQWKNDNKTRLFGKVVMYPGLRFERNYPIEAIFQGNRTINQLHVRIYNPNHTLYNFHGKDWSMTLVLVIAGATGAQMCY